MASQINTSRKNVALAAVGAACGFLALYSDAAGTTELTGGSPAYARKPVTYNSVTTGVLSTAADVTFDIPAGSTVRAIGLCTAVSGGTQHAKIEPVSVESWVGQGTCVIKANTDLTITLT